MVQLWQVWSCEMFGHICTSEICSSFFGAKTNPATRKAPGRIVCGSTSWPAKKLPPLTWVWSRQPIGRKINSALHPEVCGRGNQRPFNASDQNFEKRKLHWFTGTLWEDFEMYPSNSKPFPIAFHCIPLHSIAFHCILPLQGSCAGIIYCKSPHRSLHAVKGCGLPHLIDISIWLLFVAKACFYVFSLSKWQTPLGSRGWYPMGQPTKSSW